MGASPPTFHLFLPLLFAFASCFITFREIFVSIEEIATGCEKKMKISRKVIRQDGTRTMEDKVLKIVVKPGWKAGTKVTFAKEGDQIPGKIPADIAFIIKDKPHPLFSRDGVNLKYTYKIPLRESLCGTVVQVPTLEGTKVGINCTGEVLKPTTTKRLQGYGLPLPKEPNKRGDLIVSLTCSSLINSPRARRISSVTCSPRPLHASGALAS